MFVAFSVNFLSALWFATRIWRDRHASFGACVGFLTIFSGLVVAKWSIWWSLIILASLGVQWWAAICAKNLRYRHRVEIGIRNLVECLLLEMRSGRSFRAALAIATENLEENLLGAYLKTWLSERSAGNRALEGPIWWREVEGELFILDSQSHQAISRLLFWRARIMLMADFRRRFGQVSSQLRAQALLISGLFLALLMYSLLRGHWRAHGVLILVSTGLFLAGIAVMFSVGKRIKWSF